MAKKMITQMLKATFEYESDKYYDSIEDMCKHEKLHIPGLNIYGQRWHCVPHVKRVIINNPATIVLWEDGTKTVCKCAKGDTFDAEKGIAMCFLKKMFGNPSQVRKFMKKWIPWMVMSRVKQKDVMNNRKAYNGNSTMVRGKKCCE